MQDQIIGTDMRESDKLTIKPERIQSFGVSRAVVRNAVALLISRRLVVVRSRRNTTVKAPDGSGVAEGFVVQVQMSRISLEHLLEVRLILESSMVEIATQMWSFARPQYQCMERLFKQCVKEIPKKQKKLLANICYGLAKAPKIYLSKSLRHLMIKITLFLNFEILVGKGLSCVKKSK